TVRERIDRKPLGNPEWRRLRPVDRLGRVRHGLGGVGLRQLVRPDGEPLPRRLVRCRVGRLDGRADKEGKGQKSGTSEDADGAGGARKAARHRDLLTARYAGDRAIYGKHLVKAKRIFLRNQSLKRGM